jgi:heterodisulfide reductase subunit B
MSAEEVAAVHADYVSDYARHCTCGEWSDTSSTANYSRLNFIGHVLDALKAAGYDVVHHPESCQLRAIRLERERRKIPQDREWS